MITENELRRRADEGSIQKHSMTLAGGIPQVMMCRKMM